MKSKTRRPFSKTEWLLFLAPLAILIGLGLHTVLRALFPRTLGGHGAPIVRLRFSPDSSKLAVVSEDFTGITPKSKIHLWSIDSPSLLWSHGVNKWMGSPHFSPNGKLLFYSVDNPKGQIILRNTQVGDVERSIPRFNYFAAVNDDQIVLLNRNQIELQDPLSGTILKTFPKNRTRWINDSDWSLSPNNRILVGLDGDKTSKTYDAQPVLWDMQSSKKIGELPKRQWTSVQFVDNETLILSELEEKMFPFPMSLQLWDWKRSRPLRKIASGTTDNFLLSQDKRRLTFFKSLSRSEKGERNYKGYSISLFSVPDNKVRWAVTTKHEIRNVLGDDNLRFLLSHEIDVNIDNNKKMTLSDTAVLRDGENGQVLAEYRGVTSTAISPNGQTVAIGDAKGNVRLYDTRRFLN